MTVAKVLSAVGRPVAPIESADERKARIEIIKKAIFDIGVAAVSVCEIARELRKAHQPGAASFEAMCASLHGMANRLLSEQHYLESFDLK